jgi:hypothetical protein
VLVYGTFMGAFKKALSAGQAGAATVAVTVLMIGLAVVRLRWLQFGRRKA